MHTRSGSIQGVALLLACLSVAALFSVPGTIDQAGYAAVATVLLAFTVIVKVAYTKAPDTSTVARLVAEPEAGIVGHRLERRMQ